MGIGALAAFRRPNEAVANGMMSGGMIGGGMNGMMAPGNMQGPMRTGMEMFRHHTEMKPSAATSNCTGCGHFKMYQPVQSDLSRDGTSTLVFWPSVVGR